MLCLTVTKFYTHLTVCQCEFISFALVQILLTQVLCQTSIWQSRLCRHFLPLVSFAGIVKCLILE